MLSLIFNQHDISFPGGGLTGSGEIGLGLRRRRALEYAIPETPTFLASVRRRAFRLPPLPDTDATVRRRGLEFPEELFTLGGIRSRGLEFKQATLTAAVGARRRGLDDERVLTARSRARGRAETFGSV